MWKYYALISAFFAALSAIFSKLGVKGVDSSLATAIRTTFILVLVWGAALCGASPRAMFQIPRNVWIFLFLSAIASGLSWLFYFRALETGAVSAVAPLDKLSVPLTIILGILLLGEPLTWKIAVGGVLISFGVLLIAL